VTVTQLYRHTRTVYHLQGLQMQMRARPHVPVARCKPSQRRPVHDLSSFLPFVFPSDVMLASHRERPPTLAGSPQSAFICLLHGRLCDPPAMGRWQHLLWPDTGTHPAADRLCSASPFLALVRTSVCDWFSHPSDSSEPLEPYWLQGAVVDRVKPYEPGSSPLLMRHAIPLWPRRNDALPSGSSPPIVTTVLYRTNLTLLARNHTCLTPATPAPSHSQSSLGVIYAYLSPPCLRISRCAW
jgi:hypothetical protein